MKAGHSRKCLTPQYEPFYLLGYKNPKRNEPALGVHDDIFANALLLDEDGNMTFIWSADLLEMPDDIADDIRFRLHETYGIDRNRILLSVMHDHSSVRDFHTNWPYGRFSQNYYDFFVQSVLDAYQECLDNRQEASARYGRAIVSGFYSNRNHEGQPADNEVLVLKFYDENDQPFAGLINWAVHSTAMGASNMYLTGDIAGNTCRKLGETWGFYPVFINGDAADCSNRHDRLGTDFAELDRETTGLCQAIDQIVTDTPVSLKGSAYAVDHHVIDTDMESYHQELQDMIDRFQAGETPESSSMPVSHLIEKCQEQLELDTYHDELDTEVLDIGDLRFFIFPGEISSVLGKMLKDSCTDKIPVIAGYTNGFHYYFFHAEDYGASFETIGNPVPKGKPEEMMRQMISSASKLSGMGA